MPSTPLDWTLQIFKMLPVPAVIPFAPLDEATQSSILQPLPVRMPSFTLPLHSASLQMHLSPMERPCPWLLLDSMYSTVAPPLVHTPEPPLSLTMKEMTCVLSDVSVLMPSAPHPLTTPFSILIL